ncbi:MAG: hypothetical protein ACLQIB_38580 [Isosphaeraceae bacterium]
MKKEPSIPQLTQSIFDRGSGRGFVSPLFMDGEEPSHMIPIQPIQQYTQVVCGLLDSLREVDLPIVDFYFEVTQLGLSSPAHQASPQVEKQIALALVYRQDANRESDYR